MLQSSGSIWESPLPFDESAGFTAPSAFGTYRVLHQIGSGVLGPVFRTYDPQRDRLVAVKAFRLELLPEQVARLADALRRLVNARELSHRGIVAPLDAGLEGTTAYLATEYVAAETLDVALRHLAPAPLDRALPILTQIADALDAAWAVGFGHGSLHPRDVFVTVDSQEVRVSGIGIGQALEQLGVKPPVRRPYSAPERVNGDKWDIRADVYALGAITHELLTRRRPAGSGEQDGALTTDTTPEQRVQIRRVLSAVLAERPEHRFASARAFTDALAAIARGEPTALPEPAESRAAEPGETSAAPVVSGAAAGAAEPPAPDAAPALEPHPLSAAEPAVEAAATAHLASSAAPPAPSTPPAPIPAADSSLSSGIGASPAEATPVEPRPTYSAPRAAEPLRRAERFGPLTQEDEDQDEPALHRPAVPYAVASAETAQAETGFPWSAIVAVAVAGLAVGTVLGYQYARQTFSSRSAPVAVAAGRPAETEVAVPSEPAPLAAAPSSAPDANRQPAPAQVSARRDAGPAARESQRRETGRTPAAAAPAVAVRGRLVVRSTPAGALVLVDGRSRGQTPVSVGDLSFGEHSVEVARSGFVPHSERVALSARSPARTLNVRLQPGISTAGAPVGSVFIDSRPQAARVIMNGRFVGVTPLRVPDVRAGTHAVRLELGGYFPFSTVVGVKEGEQARVTASLEERRQDPF